jgi:CubicO group peptidase (beta-lactamase class C family)
MNPAGRATLTTVAVAAMAVAWVSDRHVRLSAQEATAFARVEHVALEELQQRQAPGAAIAIVHDGRTIYSRGFGLANVETGEEMRPEMLFRLGSTTKMFTAAAVVLLAEQGKLRLNEPIGTHIRGLSPKLAALTAHQLLSHTSGILDEAPMFGSHDDDALKNEVASWTDTRFFAEPGQIYSYSNPGYWLAGRLAEQVGGKPFADQVASSIFLPLGMSRSTFRPTIAMTYPLAQGHDLVDGKLRIVRPSANNSASWPAGSIFSNVIELSRWISAFVDNGVLDGRQVLPAAVFSTVSTPRVEIPGWPNKYGYGVQVGDWRGLQVVEHGGSRSGYGSFITMVPSRRFGVVVLANRSGVSLERTAEAAIETVLQPATAATAAKRTTMPTTAADRARFAGEYSQGPRRIAIEAQGSELIVRQAGRETPLQKTGDLELSAGESRFVFVTDAAGAITFLHSGGRSWKKVTR